MDLSSIWPNWGSQGDKPSDGKDYEQGDNVAAGSLDYLWYYIKDTFEKVETALSNKADDPHDNNAHDNNYLLTSAYKPGDDIALPSTLEQTGNKHDNAAHSKTFAVDGDAQPPQSHANGAHSKTFAVDGDAQPPQTHANGAHSKTFAVDGDAQPPQTHGNGAHTEDYITSAEVDGGAPDPHGNSSHSTNYLPSGNYDPVGAVEAATSALNVDITGDADTLDGNNASAFADASHGNGAHSQTFAVDGDAQPPENHTNNAHSTDYLPSGNYDPVGAVEATTSALTIDIAGDADTLDGNNASDFADASHGNGAHSANYLLSEDYDPVGAVEAETNALTIDIAGDADTVDGKDASAFADASHGNGAHSTNFFPQANYDPVGDVEAETSALDVDITGDADTVDGNDASAFADASHGNGAHSTNFLPENEAFAPDFRSEQHRVTDVTLNANGGIGQHIVPFNTAYPAPPTVQLTLNARSGQGNLNVENDIRAIPTTTAANDGVIVQLRNESSESVTFDIDLLVYGPESTYTTFPGTTHTASDTSQ